MSKSWIAMSLKMPPPPATYLKGGGDGSREHSLTTIRSPMVPVDRGARAEVTFTRDAACATRNTSIQVQVGSHLPTAQSFGRVSTRVQPLQAGQSPGLGRNWATATGLSLRACGHSAPSTIDFLTRAKFGSKRRWSAVMSLTPFSRQRFTALIVSESSVAAGACTRSDEENGMRGGHDNTWKGGTGAAEGSKDQGLPKQRCVQDQVAARALTDGFLAEDILAGHRTRCDLLRVKLRWRADPHGVDVRV